MRPQRINMPCVHAHATVGREFYDKTHEYWTDFSRSLHVPFEYQGAVIRAAITLKLCSYEEVRSAEARRYDL